MCSYREVKGFDWYVEKVTVPAPAEHGGMWTIPKGISQRRGTVRPIAAGIAPAVGTSATPAHPIGSERMVKERQMRWTLAVPAS